MLENNRSFLHNKTKLTEFIIRLEVEINIYSSLTCLLAIPFLFRFARLALTLALITSGAMVEAVEVPLIPLRSEKVSESLT